MKFDKDCWRQDQISEIEYQLEEIIDSLNKKHYIKVAQSVGEIKIRLQNLELSLEENLWKD